MSRLQIGWWNSESSLTGVVKICFMYTNHHFLYELCWLMWNSRLEEHWKQPNQNVASVHEIIDCWTSFVVGYRLFGWGLCDHYNQLLENLSDVARNQSKCVICVHSLSSFGFKVLRLMLFYFTSSYYAFSNFIFHIPYFLSLLILVLLILLLIWIYFDKFISLCRYCLGTSTTTHVYQIPF